MLIVKSEMSFFSIYTNLKRYGSKNFFGVNWEMLLVLISLKFLLLYRFTLFIHDIIT